MTPLLSKPIREPVYVLDSWLRQARNLVENLAHARGFDTPFVVKSMTDEFIIMDGCAYKNTDSQRPHALAFLLGAAGSLGMNVLIGEEGQVVAHRLGMPLDQCQALLVHKDFTVDVVAGAAAVHRRCVEQGGWVISLPARAFAW